MQLVRAMIIGAFLVLFSLFSSAATITINVVDGAGEGFNDTTAASPVGGNPGTTIGQQRLNLFQKAADILEVQIDSDVTIVVDAAFDPLYCDPTSATLGQAGPNTVHWNFSGVPTNTAYPQALANSILGSDASAGTSDISATFNSNINGNAGCLGGDEWYYGYDEPTGANERDLLTVVLHEILHGLGFLTFVDITTGAKYGGSLDDPYSNNLKDKSTGKAWSAMNNTERLTSVTDTGDLVWTGTDVNANVGGLTGGVNSGEMQMYAPNPSQSGSSVSHFDTAATPNEVMEPQWTEWNTDVGLALNLLKDIGWTLLVAGNTAPIITAVNQSTNEDVALTGVDASGWGSDADSDPLTYSITSCPANVSCSINSDGTNLSLTPAANYNGATNSVTIQVSDGTDTASDSFNLNVVAQNDAPSISGIPNQTIKDGEFKDITLTTYASDVDGDSLTFSDTACGANLTCTFPSTNVIRVAASGGVGTTVSVTVEADDSNGGTNSDTFDVTISSAVPSTTVAVDGSNHNDGDTFTLASDTTQIDVNNGTGNYTYDLDFNGNDVSSLVTSNANGLTVGFPSSGEFAGDYTLTITDNGDSDVITLTIKRPLRLSWSATSILNGDTTQTFKIEGGAAGTTYTLLQSGTEDLIFRDGNGAAIASADAANDAASFNAAVIHIDSHTVSAIESMDVTVQSTYDDVIESGVKVYPASAHSFTVTDVASAPIATATAELNGGEALLTTLNLELNYSADANGQFTVLLPDTSVLSAGTDFDITVSASGYNSESLALTSDTTTHNVTLTEVANGITLTGSISALGSQDFKASPPVVSLTFADGTSENIVVTVSTISQASFEHLVDLNQKSLSTMAISQADSLSINMDITHVTQNQTFNILLERNVAVVTSSPTDIGGGGSGGGGGALGWWLLLLSTVLLRRSLLTRKVKHSV